MLQRCERQLRSDMNGPYGLDLPAVAFLAQAFGLDTAWALEVAVEVEPFLIYAWRPQT